MLKGVCYDNGFGAQEIASDLCVRFKDGAMLIRCEYDGAEWWRHIPAPATHGVSFEYVAQTNFIRGNRLADLNK